MFFKEIVLIFFKESVLGFCVFLRKCTVGFILRKFTAFFVLLEESVLCLFK